MLTDITIGQYIPRESAVHNLDPRIKIISTFVFIVAVFLVDSVYSYIFLFLTTVGIVLLSQISFRTVIKSIKPIIFLVAFTAVINIFMTNANDVIFKIGVLKVTYT
ncbi:MAG: energy-coupling factor transporter transmembrane protein EcfT, partial [Clostridia bacterium]|nr:energy-coupling factor transporter transmembrane protein EcfT [Clostridia bacterium]